MNAQETLLTTFVVPVPAESGCGIVEGCGLDGFAVTAIAWRGVVNIAACTIVGGHVTRLMHNYYNDIVSLFPIFE